jgi:prolyl oligopeptidase
VLNLRQLLKREIYFKKIMNPTKPISLASGLDSYNKAWIINEKIFILTDYQAPMRKVMVTDISKPDRKYWKILIPEKKSMLQDLAFVDGNIYANYLENACTKIKIYNSSGKYLRDLPLPGIGTATVTGYWSKGPVYVEYESFTQPETTYTYNVKENRLSILIQDPYAAMYQAADLEVEQVWYPSKDKTPISMFLLHKKNYIKNGKQPTILYGYGGFGRSQSPSFLSYYFNLAKQGVIIAKPNLRGGGEYGEEWHRAGILEKKQNTIDDFISAAEWLISNKYTYPQRLVAEGRSNGGLVIAAAMVQRPDLFKAVVCSMAFLDMLRYDKYTRIKGEFADEYGTAEQEQEFRYLIKYSPYHHLRSGIKYPNVLFTVGAEDKLVNPLHSYKMAAKMMNDTNTNAVWLTSYKNLPHGQSNSEKGVEMALDEYSFILNELNILKR